MKLQYYILAFALLLLALSCSDSENSTDNALWIGVPFMPADSVRMANGEVTQQNAGPKRTLKVNSGYISALGMVNGYSPNHYAYALFFDNGDSLKFIIHRAEPDFNYHYHVDSAMHETENRILYALFNEDTLTMKTSAFTLGSALSLQPRQQWQSLHTVINVHTVSHGDLNGTVDYVPLIY